VIKSVIQCHSILACGIVDHRALCAQSISRSKLQQVYFCFHMPTADVALTEDGVTETFKSAQIRPNLKLLDARCNKSYLPGQCDAPNAGRCCRTAGSWCRRGRRSSGCAGCSLRRPRRDGRSTGAPRDQQASNNSMPRWRHSAPRPRTAPFQRPPPPERLPAGAAAGLRVRAARREHLAAGCALARFGAVRRAARRCRQ
jgi:hypothetical protein